MSKLSIDILSCRLGELNYSNNRTYFLGYSEPFFNGFLKIYSDLWETHELFYNFMYDTNKLMIWNDVNKFSPNSQSMYLKAEPYEKMKKMLIEHFNNKLGDLNVYVQFVTNAKAEYQAKRKQFKEEHKDMPNYIVSRKVSATVYTDQFDVSNVIGTIDII